MATKADLLETIEQVKALLYPEAPDLQAQLGVWQKTCENLRERLDELRNNSIVEKQELTIAELRDRLRKTREDRDEVNKIRDDLLNSLSRSDDANERRMAELTEDKVTILEANRSYEVEYAAMRVDMEAEQEKFSDLVGSLSASDDANVRMIGDLEARILELVEEKDAAYIADAALEIEATELQKANDDLADQLKSAQEGNEFLRGALGDATAFADSLRAEVDGYRSGQLSNPHGPDGVVDDNPPK